MGKKMRDNYRCVSQSNDRERLKKFFFFFFGSHSNGGGQMNQNDKNFDGVTRREQCDPATSKLNYINISNLCDAMELVM